MKTKLKNIESLDELSEGSIIVAKSDLAERRCVLGKVGRVVFVSTVNDHEQLGFSAAGNLFYNYQLEVPDEKWQPVMGEDYFLPYIDGGEADWYRFIWTNNKADRARWHAGLVNKTKEGAKATAKKMLEAINN